MLQVYNQIDTWIQEIINDDPIRPNLSAEFRINKSAEIFALWSEQSLGAVCCVRYTQGIPEDISDMQERSTSSADTAVFYTLWSYVKGSGRDLVQLASAHIQDEKPHIKNIVTLSPKTTTAERFHLRNGATTYRVNEDSVNYAYRLVNDVL